MSLRRLLLRIVDPAGARFEQRDHVRPVHRGAVVFGPGEPQGGRPPTDEELAALEVVAAEHAADYDARVEEVRRRWRSELEAAADRLRRGEPVSLRLGEHELEARVLRFWHGDSLLEITRESAHASGRSRTRIPRDPQRLPREVFVDYLAFAAA